MNHSFQRALRVLRAFVLAIALIPQAGLAQLIIGEFSFGTPPAPPLKGTVKMEDAELTPAFPAGVGGISFDRSAIPAGGLQFTELKMHYRPEATDGERLVLTIDGQEVIADLPDWMLLPIARYANSDYYSCFTLFGKLNDAQLQKDVLAAEGRVLNYHPALVNTLLGMRLAYMDMLILYPSFTTDLPKKDGAYLLGAGEIAPVERDAVHAYSLLGNSINRIQLEAQAIHRSYIISDHERRIEFDLADGHLRLTGEPYFYCWRYMYERPGYDHAHTTDSLKTMMKTQMDAAVAEKTHSSGQAWVVEKLIGVMHDYDGKYELFNEKDDFIRIMHLPTDEARRAALMKYDPNSLYNLTLNALYQMDQHRIDHMVEYSAQVSALGPLFARANPAVWNATVRTMRYGAFFRYVRQEHPTAWLAFLAQIEGVAAMPSVVTPTVLYPSKNTALKARMRP
ncbi:MAG: hypothetical protein IT226_13980 [Flavobacteriales bacterium]|nr:hypothetical protein [Flavobacteriales bacterium]